MVAKHILWTRTLTNAACLLLLCLALTASAHEDDSSTDSSTTQTLQLETMITSSPSTPTENVLKTEVSQQTTFGIISEGQTRNPLDGSTTGASLLDEDTNEKKLVSTTTQEYVTTTITGELKTTSELKTSSEGKSVIQEHDNSDQATTTHNVLAATTNEIGQKVSNAFTASSSENITTTVVSLSTSSAAVGGQSTLSSTISTIPEHNESQLPTTEASSSPSGVLATTSTAVLALEKDGDQLLKNSMSATTLPLPESQVPVVESSTTSATANNLETNSKASTPLPSSSSSSISMTSSSSSSSSNSTSSISPVVEWKMDDGAHTEEHPTTGSTIQVESDNEPEVLPLPSAASIIQAENSPVSENSAGFMASTGQAVGLVSTLVVGILFTATAFAFIAKRFHDSWRKRHYRKVNTLLSN